MFVLMNLPSAAQPRLPADEQTSTKTVKTKRDIFWPKPVMMRMKKLISVSMVGSKKKKSDATTTRATRLARKIRR